MLLLATHLKKWAARSGLEASAGHFGSTAQPANPRGGLRTASIPEGRSSSAAVRLVRSFGLMLIAALALWLGLTATAAARAAEPALLAPAALPPLTNPTCASWGPDRVDCFIIGGDGRMYHTWADLASSGDYRDFAPWVAEPSAPADGFSRTAGIAVTAWGPGRLDIMAITPDGEVYHRYWDGAAWQPADWEFLANPGNVGVTEIGCASWGVNRIDCFTRGTDRHVYQVRWDGFGWGTFDMGPLPTGTYGDNSFLGVGASAYSSNSLHQVVIAIDGNVYHRKWDGATWSGWINGGKPGADNLMTVTCQAGVIYVMDCVFQDVAGIAWHRSWYDSESRWLDWHRLTGLKTYYASGLGFSKVAGDYGALYVLAYGESGRIYLGYGRGTTSTFNWYGWDMLALPRDQRVFLPLIPR